MSNWFHFDIGLVLFLHEENTPVSVVKPLQVKHFAKAIASKTKTDAKDAQLLTLFGQKCNDMLRPLQPPSLFIQELKSLKTILLQHKKQHTATKNNITLFQLIAHLGHSRKKRQSKKKPLILSSGWSRLLKIHTQYYIPAFFNKLLTDFSKLR